MNKGGFDKLNHRMLSTHRTLSLSKCPKILQQSGGMAVIILISLAVMVALAFILSKQPGRTLWYFFLGPFRNVYNFGNMLNSSIPLIFGGLGIAISMQAGVFNLGGEGQIYSGAFITTILAIALQPLGLFGAIIALLIGSSFAGIVASFSGWLKVRLNATELITTFLLSNALILIVSWCITGPFMDPESNLQTTKKVADAFRLPRIMPPSNLSAAIIIAIVVIVIGYYFLYKSRAGYEILMTGLNSRFASYGGINTGKNIVLAMFISGFLYGFAGGLSIYGTYYSTMKEFSSGMGWNGLAVALIAGLKPQAVIPAAIFFAWLGAGARSAMQFSDVTSEVSSIVQSVLFFLVTSVVLKNLFVRNKAKTGAPL
ncbi:MAG: ABC transporter permease [Spirochaetaceae bacterium]|jgi:simple sugar transport system permease protein|nr:ABC transporter permease [Spirochaetaceae bacterium]